MLLTRKTLLLGTAGLVAVAVVGWYGFSNFTRMNVIIPGDQSNNGEGPLAPKQLGVPVKLEIPSIGVNADIEAAGLAGDGTVAVPKGPKGVTWYKLGARPGEMGSAVMTGHFGPWQTGDSSVFDKLNTLKEGDSIFVTDETGKRREFKMMRSQTYTRNAKVPEVFTKSDDVYLNLITCQGEWLKNQDTYTQRLVVFAKMVK